MEAILVQRLNPDLPRMRRAHASDAGIDLHAAVEVDLEPGEWALVATGVAVALPAAVVGLIAPRSGLAIDSGVTVLNAPGVIDAGYAGEVKVVLVNLGKQTASLPSGTRIAQLVPVRLCAAPIEEVSELPLTDRGDAGFGSTGLGP